MDELEKLEAEKRKYKAQAEVDEAMAERTLKKKNLKREIRALKHRKKIKFVKKIGKITMKGAKITGKGIMKAGIAADRFAMRGVKVKSKIKPRKKVSIRVKRSPIRRKSSRRIIKKKIILKKKAPIKSGYFTTADLFRR